VARLEGERKQGFVPVTITARLQQGMVFDPRYGVAFDGLLAAQLRAQHANDLEPGMSGSDLDGGLLASDPLDWDLPLAKCSRSAETGWHWLATTGQLVDHHGMPVCTGYDPHRMLNRLDERRAEQVAVKLPKNVGGARGRFRNKATPVLSVPAHSVIWHAVGDPVRIDELVRGLATVGARRGSGEGAVLSWTIAVADSDGEKELERWGHLNPDGSLGRPVPHECAEWLGIDMNSTGYAGLRPPMFHPSRQKLLVLPR